MANPQAEDGHTDINHVVLEKLMLSKLNGTQWCLVMAVLRKTWGWKKKDDYISLGQFHKMTGRHQNLIARELLVLQERKILLKTKCNTTTRATKWKFNKDWEVWVSPNKVSPNKVTVTEEGVTQLGVLSHPIGGPRVSPKKVTTKERRKETIQKKGLSQHLFEKWMSHKNLKRHKRLTPTMEKNIKAKKRSGYTEEELFSVVDNYARLGERAPGYGEWGLDIVMRSVQWFDSLLDDNWKGFKPKKEEKPKGDKWT